MKNYCKINIVREQSEFPVIVICDDLAKGYFDHPTDPEGDREYVLTWNEQDEARDLLSEPEADVEADEHVFTVKDADRAADAYFGYRLGNL